MNKIETAEEWDRESERIRAAVRKANHADDTNWKWSVESRLVQNLIGDRPIEAPPNVIIDGQHNISVNYGKPIDFRMVQLCLWDKRSAGLAHTRAFSEEGHLACDWGSEQLRQLIDALKDGVAYLEGTDGFKEN